MSKSAEFQSSDVIIKSRDGQERDDKETKKGKELDEIIIDSLIEHMLLEGAEKINEGNNGVIFLVNLNDLDKQTIEQLKNINPELLSPGTKSAERKDVVIKMLKIYTGGQGKREFKFQKKAYETIKEAEAQDPGKQLAKVPLPYFYRELDISQNEALQRKVKEANVNSLNKRIEVILMDFIPGKDLATFLYQEVLKYHPKTKYLAQNKNKNGLTDLDEMNIEDLQMEVAQALEFSLPPTNGLFVDDRVIRVFNENKERLINFLQNQRKNGFKMPKDIWIKLKNTIELFKQNGFEHNDLHERNIIIGRDEEIYIIDFGAAKTVTEKENELKMGTETDIEQAKIEQTLRQDRAILSTIEQLSRDIEQEAKNEDERKLAELINIIEQIIDKKPDVKQELVKLKEINKADELLEEIDKIILTNEMSSSNLEAQAQIEAGLLYKFLQENAGVFNNEQLKKIYSVYKKHYPYAYQQKLISLIIKKFLK